MPKILNRKCDTCHKDYTGTGKHYCSLFCAYSGIERNKKLSIYNLDKKMLQKTKDKISGSIRKEKHPFWGTHRSKITKEKISKNRIKSGVAKGNKNPNWKNGITKIKFSIRTCSEYCKWILDVFRRDYFTCQKCGDNKGGNLESHHLKPFSIIIKENNIRTIEEAKKCKELWDINNGITLCKECHKKTDNYGHKSLAPC